MPVVNLGVVEDRKFDLLPVGSYIMEVVTAELVTASTGNPMIKLMHKVTLDNEEFGGKVVFDQITLTPKSYGFLTNFLLALGFTTEELSNKDLDVDEDFLADLVGQEVGVRVGQEIKEGYKDKNNVKGYFNAS